MNTKPTSPLRSLLGSVRLGFLCLVLQGAAPAILRATTFTVTSTSDSGPGTLRAALASAANGDTIDLTGISGTILLTNGQLVVTNNVSIIGPGPNTVAISGNSTSRVFYVGSNTTTTITSLTITHGKLTTGQGGGGIFNDDATLVVSNCTVSGNSVSNTIYGGDYDGGGICNSAGTLTVNACTVSGNSADGADFYAAFGGGICNIGGR